ncbi:MAG: 1-deoxy-D-xylulose-5-phosphate reductoisomerase [Oscillospiraceae bacterium]|nr:1-deoxy-D-xylulose-5-phosphate reductoisomerase [Oscillospiraceae bacterium]
MKNIAVLGSTGSIGTQALSVISELGYRVTALAAHSSWQLLIEQANEYNPEIVCIYNSEHYSHVKLGLTGTGIRVVCGMDGLIESACLESTDMVLCAVVGMIGLSPTIVAIQAGKDIAIANKETLVAGGELVMSLVKEKNVKLIPVDSEHSAIFQCLQTSAGMVTSDCISKIILTASGGPFYGRTAAELENVTVSDALRHPNWNMGAKITTDSATLMNKGLEFIEACRLFELTPDQIEVVIHRESIIHSAVEFTDGAVIAQLGLPDMRLPIQYALTYPDRLPCSAPRLSLTDIGRLTFAKPDGDTFVCLEAAIESARRGGLYPCLVNMVNEYAVAEFLAGKIKFAKIGELVSGSLDLKPPTGSVTLNRIDRAAELAKEYVGASHI